MDWFNLFRDLGFFTIIISATSWVIKKYFERLFDKDLEKFKADLEVQSIEFRIRYEKLHGERVEVTREVYRKIVRTYRSFVSLINLTQMNGEPSQTEKGVKAAKDANDLVEYYEENRIFFEEELAGEIDSLLELFKHVWAKFEASRISRELRDHKTSLDQWSDAWNQIQKKFPVIKRQLENKFRNILGIKHDE